jgi:hypothetical protein
MDSDTVPLLDDKFFMVRPGALKRLFRNTKWLVIGSGAEE